MSRAEVKRFKAINDNGKHLLIIVYADIIDGSGAKGKNEIHGQEYFESQDGDKVKEIFKGTFQVVKTGEIYKV
ncbi:MAG: hypothetical protein IEMM0008_0902 [bacterium]|nr:MAG: hypothetical protein IEMM0008_0902 [bacterium]